MLCTNLGIADVSVGERRNDIRRMLLDRRRELLCEIQNRVRDVRELGSNNHHQTVDLRDTVEAEPEDDLALALIQMKADTLARVNVAVRQLDDGTYGYCIDCGEAIAPSRLRAMLFAVRCRDCEESRERVQHQNRGPVRRMPSWVGSRD
jgi:DnaK suppressor protein